MTPDVVDKVFEPFFTTKEMGKGTGLGLSALRGFVEQSGGQVVVESELAKGTSVSMYFPATRGDPAEVVAARTNKTFGKATVLVVEDDPDVLAAIAAMLIRVGYRALEAADGPSALEILERGDEIDLMLSDIVMPGGMSGIELGRTVADRYPGVRVLLTSGYPDSTFMNGDTSEIEFPFLRKPYSSEELAEAIQNVLRE